MIKDQEKQLIARIDTFCDAKSITEAIQLLKDWSEQSKRIKREYTTLHRMLREGGIKLNLPHTI